MVRIEPVSRLLADGLEDLTYQEWEEVELPQTGLPLAMDWKAILAAEKDGTFVGFGARHEGRLVGYNGFHVFRSYHFGSVHALNEAFFVERPHRARLGPQMIRTAEAEFFRRGVPRIIYGSKVPAILNGERPRDRVGELLRCMGYDHIESLHAKTLGRASAKQRKTAPGIQPDRPGGR